MLVNPVMFPPGRARLSTRPAATGSAPLKKTIGTVLVAFLAARASVVESVIRTSTLRRTSSSARAGLCSRYHDPGKGNEYIEKDTVKYAIGIPEEVFEKAVKEFVEPGAHDCVEVEMPTLRLRLGTGGLRFCEAGTNPFT
jgi:hypothetical protein